MKNIDNTVLLRNIYRNFTFIKAEVDLVSGAFDYEVLPQWDMWYDEVLMGKSDEAIPDITLITLSNMKFDFSDYVDFLDVDLIKETIVSITLSLSDIAQDKAKRDYISGKSTSYHQLYAAGDYIEKAEPKAIEYVGDFKRLILDAIGKGVISGTRKFVLDNPTLDSPDDLIDTNVLSYVKLSIDAYVDAVVRLFENIISDTINNMIDGDNNDGTTQTD